MSHYPTHTSHDSIIVMKMSFVKSLIGSFTLSVFAMQNQAIAQIKRYYSESDKSETETVTTITSDQVTMFSR